jgi:hypothetical protein
MFQHVLEFSGNVEHIIKDSIFIVIGLFPRLDSNEENKLIQVVRRSHFQVIQCIWVIKDDQDFVFLPTSLSFTAYSDICQSLFMVHVFWYWKTEELALVNGNRCEGTYAGVIIILLLFHIYSRTNNSFSYNCSTALSYLKDMKSIA